MKKVFLEYISRHNNRFDWKLSIGCKVKFIYDDIEGIVEIINYEAKTECLSIKYLEKEVFKINSTDFKKCRLGKILDKRTSKFKIEIGTNFKDNKRDLLIIDRENKKDKQGKSWKWYKYRCNKCVHEGWITEYSLLKGNNCSCCCDSPQVVIEGINDIPTTAPWMIKYFQGGYDEAKLYNKSSNKKIYSICPDCGRIKNKEISIYSIHKNHSIGCTCSDGQSYPSKFMISLLQQLNISFETEYNPYWIKPKRYDFYFELNNKEYIIEMDGEWHKKDNKMSGQTKEQSNKIDDYKDKLAREHNIKVVRIDCFESESEYIKQNIINSELNNIFDLSIINWLKCEEFALSNLVKIACEYKKNNPNLTTSRIGNIMKISYTTICKYLKQGMKLGWCYYDAKEELHKRSSKGYKVEIFKNEISLGIFKSMTELSNQSEYLFNIKLSYKVLSSIRKGKRKSYKGYTFKYI